MSANNTNDSASLPPSEIDGLKVKENVNANLNAEVKLATALATSTSPISSTNNDAISSTKTTANKRPGTRCHECRKKVPISALKCKCGEVFCAQHRMAEDHKCTFDFKTLYREKLKDNLQQVVSAKVSKI